MKILSQITESANIRSLTAAANKFIDTKLQQEIAILSKFLSPQWHAGYMGLKKLIEKDYHSEEEDLYLHSFTNA